MQYKNSELFKIAKRSGANKKYLRSFMERYEQIFSPIKNEYLNILEIGIGGYKEPGKGGGSLLTWAEYFPNATIVGLDNCVKNLKLPNNVVIKQGSQTDTELLNNLAIEYGGFDIIIDDASHVTNNTILSFETLWPSTRLFYIVEDLHMLKAVGTEAYFKGIAEADFITPNMCVLTKLLKLF